MRATYSIIDEKHLHPTRSSERTCSQQVISLPLQQLLLPCSAASGAIQGPLKISATNEHKAIRPPDQYYWKLVMH